MANVALTSAGIRVYYAVETTAGTKPTQLSAYTEIPDVVEIPEMGTDVNTLDYTPLSEEVQHLYTEGLADIGGAFTLTVNDTPAFRTAWNSFVTASATGWAASTPKATHICIVEKGHDDAFWFEGKPVPFGFGGASVDAILQTSASILPMSSYSFAAKPTSGNG